MPTKRTKEPVAPRVPEVTQSDRDMLIGAYRSGLISGWKRDSEHAYRLTVMPKGDDAYVEVAKLTRYLDGLKKNSA
jgi:hypothetical protein